MEEKKYEGGFVWYNKGLIEGSFSSVRLDKKDREGAGFAYENAGTIDRCFSRSIVRRKRRDDDKKKGLDGFCVDNTGYIRDSFFVVKDKDELKNYRDKKLGIAKDKAEPEDLEKTFRWDYVLFEKKNAAEMDFRPERWHTTAAPAGEPIKIKNKRTLLRVIDRINSGDAAAAHASYVLTRNLNLRGRKIQPIGCDGEHPFYGTFDGGGHRIRGFVLDGKGLNMVGFFGHLYGKAMNLRIDCVVEGKDCPLAAAFCAMNFGDIICCEAVCAVHAKRDVGAFVGENYGHIRWCAVSGESRWMIPIWPWLLPLLPLLLLALCPLVYPIQEPPEYEPILADAGLEKNDDFGAIAPRGNDNMLSFTMPEEITFDAATLTADTKNNGYVILNPNRGANFDFVAIIYMTNSAGNRVEVYRSGLIPVGYHIDSITLTPPDGVQLGAGIYEAEVAFDFYHHETGEKGMIDSTLPVKLRIE